jgi:hypothetical protein
VASQRAIRTRFGLPPRAVVPNRRSILKWVKDFREHGNVTPKIPQRVPHIVTPENIARVQVSVEESPRRSTRHRTQALGISRRSLQTILNEHLKFYPYKIMLVQKIFPRDHLQREQFSVRMLEILQDQYALFMTSGEAHFHLDGYVNKQNCRYRAHGNPRRFNQQPLHSEKVTVWCALSKVGIIGHYFFENESGQTVTVNSERYVAMLQDYFFPYLEKNEIDTENIWF